MPLSRDAVNLKNFPGYMTCRSLQKSFLFVVHDKYVSSNKRILSHTLLLSTYLVTNSSMVFQSVTGD